MELSIAKECEAQLVRTVTANKADTPGATAGDPCQVSFWSNFGAARMLFARRTPGLGWS